LASRIARFSQTYPDYNFMGDPGDSHGRWASSCESEPTIFVTELP
jgi:hypothetical protein